MSSFAKINKVRKLSKIASLVKFTNLCGTMQAGVCIAVLLFCTSCSGSVDKQIFENHKYKFIYSEQNGKCIHFELVNKYTRTPIISGRPQLYEDDVIERNPDIDFNDPLINYSYGISIYQCDSTYDYDSKFYGVTFAREIITGYRLSLSLISFNDLSIDDYCTLYRTSPHTKERTYLGEDCKIHVRD